MIFLYHSVLPHCCTISRHHLFGVCPFEMRHEDAAFQVVEYGVRSTNFSGTCELSVTMVFVFYAVPEYGFAKNFLMSGLTSSLVRLLVPSCTHFVSNEHVLFDIGRGYSGSENVLLPTCICHDRLT
jgi:hypothetical protein